MASNLDPVASAHEREGRAALRKAEVELVLQLQARNLALEKESEEHEAVLKARDAIIRARDARIQVLESENKTLRLNSAVRLPGLDLPTNFDLPDTSATPDQPAPPQKARLEPPSHTSSSGLDSDYMAFPSDDDFENVYGDTNAGTQSPLSALERSLANTNQPPATEGIDSTSSPTESKKRKRETMTKAERDAILLARIPSCDNCFPHKSCTGDAICRHCSKAGFLCKWTLCQYNNCTRTDCACLHTHQWDEAAGDRIVVTGKIGQSKCERSG